jgi:hypothetical protein
MFELFACAVGVVLFLLFAIAVLVKFFIDLFN